MIRNSATTLLLCACAVCFAASEQLQNDAVGAVLDILKSDDQEMQTVAISMVREMEGTELTMALAAELPNLSATIQVQLVSALGDRGDSAALPAVITATKAADPSVRVAALRALGQLGDASCVGLLAQTAATTTGEERKAARDSLYRLRGSDIDQTILSGIPEAESKVRVELIRGVGERNITAGVETLLKTARDADSRVRQESVKVLRTVADEKHLPSLVKLLIDIGDASVQAEAEKTVAAIARRIEDRNRRAEAVLGVLPSVKDTQKRCSLLSVLGRIGDDSALAVLRAALGSDNIQEQGAALRALSNWPNAKPINDLLVIAKTSETQTHKLLALRGFIRLLGLESDRPAEKTVKMYQQAMDLSLDAREKRMVLSGLVKVRSLAALEMAASYLRDAALQQEAEVAVVQIAEGTCAAHPEQTKNFLNNVIKASKNDSVRQKAQEIVRQIEVPQRQAVE